ncbi:MAG TPA: hypothetical protein VF197_17525 [Methylomirabilota bacterium]
MITGGSAARCVVSYSPCSSPQFAWGRAARTFTRTGGAPSEAVALLPLFQIKYLMTRAGRRVYARA